MTPVVIVGGGLSGLAAGLRLSSAGRSVVLLEQRAYPGGRTYSFRDPLSGAILDNGQHLLIAAYRRTLAYLRTVGTADKVVVQKSPEILFHHPERGFQSIRLPLLPPPFHLTAGIVRSGLVGPREKLAMLRAGLDLFRDGGRGRSRREGLTVSGWLERTHQPEECRRSFWEPLAIAIMNEQPDVASAAVYLRALHEAFFTSNRGAAFVTPSAGLSELFVHAAVERIQRLHGEVRCGAEAREVSTRDGRAAGVVLSDGTHVPASAVILAVPPERSVPLLPGALRTAEGLQEIAGLPPSPIICVHLWYKRDVMNRDVTGLIGRRVQWVFNTGRVAGGGQARVAAVISAASHLVGRPNSDLAAAAADDVAAVYGPAAGAPLRSLVIRERRATISLTPRVESIRPGPRTGIGNLFLAGDWTATGFPATIEGAIVSGERAADLVIAEM